MASFDVILQTRGSLHPHGEPDELVSEYTGVVTCTDDETGVATKVGKVTAMRVHAGLASDAGESLFEVCDAHSQELHVLHTLLYEPGGYGFREKYVNRFDAYDPDLLVLDYVVLSPRWRGLRLGLLAARKVVDLLGGGCGLVASHVAPLRPDAHRDVGVPRSWLPAHPTADALQDGTVRLRGYFRRLGFVRLGRTPYYLLPTARLTPTAEDILKPGRVGDRGRE